MKEEEELRNVTLLMVIFYRDQIVQTISLKNT